MLKKRNNSVKKRKPDCYGGEMVVLLFLSKEIKFDSQNRQIISKSRSFYSIKPEETRSASFSGYRGSRQVNM